MEGESPAKEEMKKEKEKEKHRHEGRGGPKKSNTTTKNKKRKEFAPFGNYRNYYGYRVGQDLGDDPRLKVLKKEWFDSKDCLDVGCNNGLITIHLGGRW